jgi:hypothetical protein
MIAPLMGHDRLPLRPSMELRRSPSSQSGAAPVRAVINFAAVGFRLASGQARRRSRTVKQACSIKKSGSQPRGPSDLSDTERAR